MSRRMKTNLILLAGMVLPPLSYILLGWLTYDGAMIIAAIPVVGYIYPCLPFTCLQLMLCYNFRGRFSRLVRLLPLAVVAPVQALGWYGILVIGGAAGIPGIMLIIFTLIPAMGIGLGWVAWPILRRRGIL